MLQRGRGLGFLKALSDPVAARPLVVRCAIEDPRTDRQVEDRKNYYGELAVALDLEIAPLTEHLFSPDDDRFDEFRTGLTLGVLAHMARRGRTDAVPVLREYVQRGFNWNWAAYDLASISASAAAGLADALAGRLDDREIDATGHESGGPWDRWRSENARFAEAHRKADRARPSPQADQTPTETLLEMRNGWGVLRHRTAEAETFRRTARDAQASLNARRNALIVLGHMRDRSLIEIADEALSSGSKDLRFGAWRYFMQLLKDGPLVEIRRWSDRRGDHRRLAAHMLGDWGTEADAPDMRAMLADFAGDDDYFYSTCDLVEGLARVGDAEDLPMLRRTFEETDYSYLRVRAGRGLARLLPAFPTTVAVECLWDCEDGLRVLGCQFASLDAPRVIERLRALNGSTLEEPNVRDAARARLA